MEKSIYRIEIISENTGSTHTFYIGKDLDLVSKKEDAVLCTRRESMIAMDMIDAEAACYREAE